MFYIIKVDWCKIFEVGIFGLCGIVCFYLDINVYIFIYVLIIYVLEFYMDCFLLKYCLVFNVD